MKKTFAVILFTIAAAASQAQTLKEFVCNPDAFFQQMEKFLMETNPDEGENLMTEFQVIWNNTVLDPKTEEKMYKAANAVLKKRMKTFAVKEFEYSPTTPRLTEEQKAEVCRTSNTMLKKRMKAFPDFKNYLYALISFELGGQSEQSFRGWQASIDKLLLKSNKYFNAYINSCNNLFANNSIYSSVSTRWVTGETNFTFDFDTLPKVIFNDLIDLKCYAKEDSSVIYETKGVYYPTQEKWYGSGGKVNWSRGGLDQNEVHASLKNYVIDATGSDYDADSVTFYYKSFFNNPLFGHFSDKLLANVTKDNATYPRFESYTKLLEIKNIANEVNYRGGFAIHGVKIIGKGSNDQDAYLFFYRKKKEFIVASSKSFIIRPERITSDRTAVTIYVDTTVCYPHCDSIYHPGVQMKFNVVDRELSLLKTEEGVSKSPYFDSFHKIDLYFDALYWKMDEPVINIKMISGAGESKAVFESSNYYKDARFNRILGLAEVHPFTVIRRFSDKQQSREIYTSDLAQYMKCSMEQARALLISLASQGFLIYYSGEDKVYVKDRLFYYLQANIGKVDYDVLQFESLVSSGKPNASINLLDFEIKINGISQIQVSDSQSVRIIPKDKEVILHKNRDFTFSGRVNAGRFEYFGKEFSFDYDNFRINLNNIDSMRMKVPGDSLDAFGQHALVPVKTVVQYISGNLLIDSPNNKSGVKDYPSYPVFNSFKDSYVFYEKPSIQNGVYPKDRFFFHLTPFSIDSLNTFDPSGLGLHGTFVSASIFPDFEEDLRLQKDYSLGFIRNTPDAGFPVYGGKATYLDTIKMSHEGLRGSGTLNYVTSVTKSDSYIFFPDSMNAVAFDFEIKPQGKAKGAEFPHVLAKNVYEHWLPYRDRMYVHKISVPMDFYDGQALMNGRLTLSTGELRGDGIMAFTKAELEAKNFLYKETTFGADTSDFRLNSDEAAMLAFSTINVKSNIDFVNRVGEFKSNGKGSYVNFGINQYICFMDQFKWFMDKKEVELSAGAASSAAKDITSDSDVKLEGSEFISVHPEQDSLRFVAPFARYSLKDFVIRAEGVRYLMVADAIVFPDSGKVTVEKKAKMQTFENARITANSVTKYHSIYNATVNVTGRKRYIGSGLYDYVDASKKKQTITFSKITVDTTFQTFASTDLPDTSNFTIIPQISYKGSVTLTASNQYLNFTGFAKINFNCSAIERSWFRFSSDINPYEVYIPITEPQNENNEKLSASISLVSDSLTYIKTNFLTRKGKTSDVDIVPSSGYLFYDKAGNEYRISSREKIENKTLPGNYLSFNDTKCISYAEGKLDLGADLGQVKIRPVGNITHNINNNSNEMDMIMPVTFFMEEDALKEMSDNLAASQGAPPVNTNRAVYEKGLAEIFGKEKSDKLIAELSLYGAFKKMPQELQASLFLNDLRMKWNGESKSFRSEGDSVGIGNILKTQLNRKVKGMVELVKKRSGDVLNIYLEWDNSWYFFSYTKGMMQTISSSTKYNDIIRNVKPEKRISKGEREEGGYQFILSTERRKNDFMKKFGGGSSDE